MVLQAFVDDSGSEPQSPLFVLAGFMSTAEQWADFSTDWAAALAEPPALEYFKAKEANRLRGQFDRHKGWDEERRDNRVSALISIIRKHAISRIHASVRTADFNTYIKNLPLPSRRLTSESPYTLLFMQIILSNAAWMAAHGDRLRQAHGPVDFIFDNQIGFSDEALLWWPSFKRILDEASRTDLPQYVGSAPIFRDEKQFLPLQAADLYAWHLRRNFVENQVLWMPPRRELRQFDEMPGFGRNLLPAEMNALHIHLVEVGRRFREKNPKVPFFASEEWARRPKSKKVRVGRPTSLPRSRVSLEDDE